MAKIFKKLTTGGGSAEFNIAYGDTAPTDTSKLWIKTNAPDEFKIASEVLYLNSELKKDISTLPTARSGLASATVGTKIYLFGGTNAINVFDTETNIVKTLSATLPVSISSTTAAAVGTKIYLFGGVSNGANLDTIYVFDTVTNSVSKVGATLSNARTNMASAAVGTKIYLFGGYTTAYINTISVFDTESNAVYNLSTYLPSVAGYVSAQAVGTNIYLFGGTGGGYNKDLSRIDVFNTLTNTITTLSATLPSVLYGVASAAVGTKIYLFGGIGGYYSNRVSTICEFDTESNTITKLDKYLPKATAFISASAVGSYIYLFGGNYSPDGVSATALNTINVFGVELSLTPNNVLIEVSTRTNIFDIVPNMRLGVAAVYRGNADGIAEKVDSYLYDSFKSGVDYTDQQYTSSATETTSGTELTASVDCNVGDLVVAAIATRDTLTVSNGWTLISTSGINSTDTAGNGHRLSWAYKFAESTTESITVTQASAQRLYINMVALQGATGVTDYGYSYRDDTTSRELTVNKPSGLVLWGMTMPMWITSAPYPLWSASTDMPIIQLGENTASRLGIGLDQSNDESVTLTGGSESTMIVGCLTVQGMEKFCTITPYTRNVWREIGGGSPIVVDV